MRRPANAPFKNLSQIVRWYFERVYRRWEGPGLVPFYCDPQRVGHFAVEPAALARGSEAAVFRVFVGMAMFQARRDVLVMAQQHSMPRAAALNLTSPARLLRLVRASPCSLLSTAADFDRQCSVQKVSGVVTCDHHPGVACHVKDASLLMRRMGGMGKLPTSALLHFWSKPGAIRSELNAAIADEAEPTSRAALLAQRFARVYRVGRKLATMFVSALSVPALAPTLTPWHPKIDGSALVVVDTNVAQAVALLRPGRRTRSYDEVASWIREIAREIDLRRFRPELPRYSPRLVQQALYQFRSRSNRIAHADPCARSGGCSSCVKSLCPF